MIEYLFWFVVAVLGIPALFVVFFGMSNESKEVCEV